MNIDKAVERIEHALADKIEVRVKNEPTMAKNREIRKRNEPLKKLNEETFKTWDGLKKDAPIHALEKTLKMPHRITDENAALLEAESITRAELNEKTPDQWEREISKLRPYAVRLRVACLVWWDYFGGRKYTDRWPHLDGYLGQDYIETESSDVAAGLRRVGYTPYMSEKRVLVLENAESEEPELAEVVQ